MDDKNKKIIIAVVALVVAITAFVVGVVVHNNNKNNKKPDGEIVDQVDGVNPENSDKIELGVDENGDIIILPDKDNALDNDKADKNDPNNKDNSANVDNKNDGESVSKPHDPVKPNDPTEPSNPNDPTEPAKPQVDPPSAVGDLTITNDEKSLYVSWNDVKADGYEVSFRDASNDLSKWQTASTTKTSVNYPIEHLVGVNLAFRIIAYNVDSNGVKAYSEPSIAQYKIKTEEIQTPARNVTAEIWLPKISETASLTIYVNGIEKETREIKADLEAESPRDRVEIFYLGEYKDSVVVKAELIMGNEEPIVGEKETISNEVIVSLRGRDIEILPEVIE